MGLAVGYLLTLLLGIKQSDFGFWIMLIAGLGLGMLLTFFIKVKMEEKNKENSIEKNE